VPLSIFFRPLHHLFAFALQRNIICAFLFPFSYVFYLVFFFWFWGSDNFFHFRYATTLFLGKWREVQCVFYYVNVWNCYAPYENSHMRRHTRLGCQSFPLALFAFCYYYFPLPLTFSPPIVGVAEWKASLHSKKK